MRQKRYELTITQNVYAQMEIGENCRGTLNMSVGFLLKGICDFQRLDRAVRKLIARHDAMRMLLKEDEKGLYFQILKESSLGLEVVSLSFEGRDARYAEAIADTEIRVKEPISASDLGMYRFWCYKLTEEEVLMVYMVNHLATDGCSMAIINQELAKLYENPDRTDLPDCASFSEFLEEKQRLWKEELTQEERDYWEDRVSGYENPKMEPPKIIEEKTSMEYGCFILNLSQVSKIARKSRTSNFNVVFPLVQLAFAQLTGQNDIALRYAFANRFKEKFQRTVGFLTHGVTLRHTFTPEEKWSELSKMQRDNINKDMKHLNFSDMIVVQEYLLSYVMSSGSVTKPSNKFGELDVKPLVFYSKSNFGRRYIGLVAVEHEDMIYVTPYCDNNLYSKEFILSVGKTINKYINCIVEMEDPTVAELFA